MAQFFNVNFDLDYIADDQLASEIAKQLREIATRVEDGEIDLKVFAPNGAWIGRAYVRGR